MEKISKAEHICECAIHASIPKFISGHSWLCQNGKLWNGMKNQETSTTPTVDTLSTEESISKNKGNFEIFI
jgi:hypothetical protein